MSRDCSLGVISQSKRLSCGFVCTLGTKYDGWGSFLLDDGYPLIVISSKAAWFSEGDFIEPGDFIDFTDLEDLADRSYFNYFNYFPDC